MIVYSKESSFFCFFFVVELFLELLENVVFWVFRILVWGEEFFYVFDVVVFLRVSSFLAWELYNS